MAPPWVRVAAGGFWAEVKRVNRYTLNTPGPDVPLPTVGHEHERYRLELESLHDGLRDVVLIRYRLDGPGLRLHPFGQYGVRLALRALSATSSIEFTRCLSGGGRWDGQDHHVRPGGS